MNEVASTFRRLLRLGAGALLGAALCAGTAAAAGDPIQPLTAITAAAQDFVRSQMPSGERDIVITAARLDPRLRLARCGGPLQASLLSGARLQAQMSVAVACR